ncbi:hypothetical protein [Limosilactobacillus fastidiosus]|uniref:Uncharacterized protein n=1 Tax=Limosilactobacillus fastidiosus TaxID=2759855 RepID=A0A7W3TZZ4_9LACO|nr:hypothetical protein [Limosilactobacillus fastidiosus]MBB1086398.1 hypothetical protein [Limosilactobacillus fastidiosus]MCD7086227.1 hypothetical protein [Limosilactobacillus fastidiosus]MCD7114990.1 hypothetical protein [Limosilactobacillus fastidiosus]MCD7116847.1 hypothetical protein [Limosilactobacillus fastidiosus]
MKIDEFIEKVSWNDRMEAERVGSSMIAIYDDSEHEIIGIPCNATNLLEITFLDDYSIYSFGKQSREYLSALIEEFLHTPVKERSSEKKYRLRWLKDKDNGYEVYVGIKNKTGCWCFDYDADCKTIFNKRDLELLKKWNPELASAIDVMKEPVEE